MSRLRFMLALGLAAGWLEARPPRSGGPGLEYWAHLRLAEEPRTLTLRFRLEPQLPKVTRNKVQKPRLAPWNLVVIEAPEGWSGAALLARVEPLLYFSGPAPGLVKVGTAHPRGESHRGPLWQVSVPATVSLRADLVEVKKGLLAVHHLEGSLPGRGIQDVHLDLASVRLGARTAPAEHGTILLATLQRAGLQPSPAGSSDTTVVN